VRTSVRCGGFRWGIRPPRAYRCAANLSHEPRVRKTYSPPTRLASSIFHHQHCSGQNVGWVIPCRTPPTAALPSYSSRFLVLVWKLERLCGNSGDAAMLREEPAVRRGTFSFGCTTIEGGLHPQGYSSMNFSKVGIPVFQYSTFSSYSRVGPGVGNTACLPVRWTARALPCVYMNARLLEGFQIGN
jgi:hypothetical protein